MPSNHTSVKLFDCLDNAEVVTAEFSNLRFPIHFHDTFVIQLVTAGVDWCCGNDLVANRNELFVHFPYASHTGGTMHGRGLAYRAIYPSENLFSELTGLRMVDVPRGISVVSSDLRMINAATSFFRTCDRVSANDRDVRRCLQALCCLIVELAFDGKELDRPRKPRASVSDKLEIARDYLANNFQLDVSISELSDCCGLSRFHMIREFKMQYGITPRQYLLSQRVAESKRLIAAGVSIAEAAYRTGFADQSHLSRNFKRITSFTPGKLKPQVQSGAFDSRDIP